MRGLIAVLIFLGGITSSYAYTNVMNDLWHMHDGPITHKYDNQIAPLSMNRPGQGGWGRGGYGRNLVCTAVDAGHEEHWRGHGSCGECLSMHGRCIESCSRVESYYSCQFEGVSEVGRPEVFVGEDVDRRYAELAAENRCYRSGYKYCRYKGCDIREQRQLVSRRYCR